MIIQSAFARASAIFLCSFFSGTNDSRIKNKLIPDKANAKQGALSFLFSRALTPVHIYTI
jgi:hypothetical protein